MEWTEEHCFKLALTGNDQLRQRVAWALSQIWVVSGMEIVRADAMLPYIRLLQDRAFGNFYDLMHDVTLNPAMGEYLDMVNNKKAIGSSMPNENFPREVLQLFTIGLAKLNPDGTQRLNAMGQPIPTYGQDDVLELAKVTMGWTYPDDRAWQRYPFLSDLSVEMGQWVFHSPSVFNYYSPNYRIPGTQLTGPEFQLYTAATGMIRANFVAKLISGGFGSEVTLNLTPWTTLAADAGLLVNRIDVLAFGGTMSTEVRNAMLTEIARASSPREKVLTAFYVAFTSYQFQVEH